MKTCGLLFEKWRGELEGRRELWFIRRIQRNEIWRNAAARSALNLPECGSWEDTSAILAETSAAENAHSLALKTRKPVWAKTKLAGNLQELVMVYRADYCPTCGRKCAIVLALGEIVSVAVSEEPSSPR